MISENFPAGSNSGLRVALDARAELGEGAVWDARAQALLWVDIAGKSVSRFDPEGGTNRGWKLDTMPGTVAPAAGGGLVVAVNEGIARLDCAEGRMSLVCAPEGHDAAAVRFNDGKCDPRGRLVAGTTSLRGERGVCGLFSFDAAGGTGGGMRARKLLDGVSISNGVAWSADGGRMYHIDTPTREVAVFDYDAERGEIVSGRRVAVRVPEALGYPDGMTIDAEGMLWVCLWEGGAVTRWNPATGMLLGKYDVPALHVTSCAFGGRDLDTLFITTARVDTPAEALVSHPQTGAIFAMKPGVRGVRAAEFAG